MDPTYTITSEEDQDLASSFHILRGTAIVVPDTSTCAQREDKLSEVTPTEVAEQLIVYLQSSDEQFKHTDLPQQLSSEEASLCLTTAAKVIYAFHNQIEALLHIITSARDDEGAEACNNDITLRDVRRLFQFLNMDFWKDIAKMCRLNSSREVVLYSGETHLLLDTFKAALKARVDGEGEQEFIWGAAHLDRTKAWLHLIAGKGYHSHSTSQDYDYVAGSTSEDARPRSSGWLE